MRITHLGHACLLVEAAGVRLLIDPGVYSPGAEDQGGLTAILVTHAHPDHVDPDRLARLRAANPGAVCLIEPETISALGLDDSDGIKPAEVRRLGEVEVSAAGGRHAANHDQVPPLGNVGFLIRADGQTLFHPGDSYDETPAGVDVLAVPLNAPWCRMQQTLDFVRAVRPRVAIPIHDGLLNDDGRSTYRMHLERFGPDGTRVVALPAGASYDA